MPKAPKVRDDIVITYADGDGVLHVQADDVGPDRYRFTLEHSRVGSSARETLLAAAAAVVAQKVRQDMRRGIHVDETYLRKLLGMS